MPKSVTGGFYAQSVLLGETATNTGFDANDIVKRAPAYYECFENGCSDLELQ